MNYTRYIFATKLIIAIHTSTFKVCYSAMFDQFKQGSVAPGFESSTTSTLGVCSIRVFARNIGNNFMKPLYIIIKANVAKEPETDTWFV